MPYYRGSDPGGCALVVFILILAFIGVKFGVGMWGALSIFALIVVILGALGWWLQRIQYERRPACPSCGSKAGFGYTFSRIDGGPDRRYHHNPVRCISCRAERQALPTHQTSRDA